MRKKICFFGLVLILAIIGAFNLNIVQNEKGDIHLQNVEVLSYGESGTIIACFGIGSLDCTPNGTKVYAVW